MDRFQESTPAAKIAKIPTSALRFMADVPKAVEKGIAHFL